MISNLSENKTFKSGKFILCLHSCSETFGVAVLDYVNPEKTFRVRTFPIGRSLSNKIISCVEELLPSLYWKNIVRMAVATGPGGFTSTRLSICMARTIAQQAKCQLDGISGFLLMAPRLAEKIEGCKLKESFWITKDIGRKGTVAGEYKIRSTHRNQGIEDFAELHIPQLIRETSSLKNKIEADENVKEDIIVLTNKCLSEHKKDSESQWYNTLPIYPTSPVENK